MMSAIIYVFIENWRNLSQNYYQVCIRIITKYVREVVKEELLMINLG